MRPGNPANIPVRADFNEWAYHGTNRSAADQIKSGGFKIDSSNPEGKFYGCGVYFFEDSFHHASKWAKDHHRNNGPCVFRATVHFGRCLNLNDSEFIDMIVYFKQSWNATYKQQIKSNAQAIQIFGNKWLIDTVKGHNVPYGTDTPQGFPMVQMQIIVCVKNLGKISNVKEVQDAYE